MKVKILSSINALYFWICIKKFLLSTTNVKRESTYWDCSGRILRCLNSSLQESTIIPAQGFSPPLPTVVFPYYFHGYKPFYKFLTNVNLMNYTWVKCLGCDSVCMLIRHMWNMFLFCTSFVSVVHIPHTNDFTDTWDML
jgi:hypothetical protein